ncbi:hypothetical protein GL325_04440 [Aeromicrobium sp. 636]|uniref:Uncharacterized protein n=1 Tax=Aeromicrobium senzhongii TaxID=2663859 RepID=A0A8I0K2A9_9ACTN|nr:MULTISPECIES: hypothetical protein [Aeromicrobium]MBC9225565.1 hypothetical protein [Aeromicrobium senzhongii]MCQ3997675.1 hypothetical protein [Aeromicrobium sp. 636]MTB87602.1 hypothetical protein [Aeromicrobium senzhongii]QNL95359.1 hypothetical protein H9L21_05385 [Aeromicrobium senzhongii]
MTSRPDLRHRAARAFGWLALIGVALGIGFGLFSAGALTATGVTSADLPPLAAPTSEPETTATPEPEPTPEEPQEDDTPKPRLNRVPGDRVAPGERFAIVGVLPSVDAGTVLQIQVKDGDGPWDDFPVTVTARDGGSFETKIYTSRTGERKFRVIDKASGDNTPDIPVTIG